MVVYGNSEFCEQSIASAIKCDREKFVYGEFWAMNCGQWIVDGELTEYAVKWHFFCKFILIFAKRNIPSLSVPPIWESFSFLEQLKDRMFIHDEICSYIRK